MGFDEDFLKLSDALSGHPNLVANLIAASNLVAETFAAWSGLPSER